ncbi:MAG: LysM peptidoglycan-binding domain-containing protein [Muribaculaceae bacterium]|nr:LysM peptidoglycan-binding domain-containing protein [Muribaculaceae bacterium]
MKFSPIFRRGTMLLTAIFILAATLMQAGILSKLPTIRVNGKVVYYYDTQSGDNIYTVADKLGVSVETIRANNPSVADGIKPRMRLFFPSEIATSAKGDSAGPLTHIVAKGESIYGIAREHNISMDSLIGLNPEAANGIAPGMRLRLSDDAGMDAKKSESPVAEDLPDAPDDTFGGYDADESFTVAADVVAANTCVTETDSIAVSDHKEMHVAIILPFLLGEQTVGRQTDLYTEFYKGFLLAADSVNLPGRTPVRIHAYDSAASVDTVRAIMRRPELATIDMIIAPDNADQLKVIADGAPDHAWILNVFAVRDTSYLTIPGMIQTNIPHDAMYDRAISGFIDTFSDMTPVFISRIGGRNDKKEFTDRLKAALSMKGIVYRTVSFDGYMADDHLAEFDTTSGRYVFIPESGNRDEFSRFVHALKSLKGSATDPQAVRLFGYPEWATFRGAQFDEICDLSTTIYSRYAPIENDHDASRVNQAYRTAYGDNMLDKQMPVLGILGFDTGTMVIEGLRTMARTDYFPSRYNGIQSGIHLSSPAQSAGLYNDALFLITYRPGGFIEKTLK